MGGSNDVQTINSKDHCGRFRRTEGRWPLAVEISPPHILVLCTQDRDSVPAPKYERSLAL